MNSISSINPASDLLNQVELNPQPLPPKEQPGSKSLWEAFKTAAPYSDAQAKSDAANADAAAAGASAVHAAISGGTYHTSVPNYNVGYHAIWQLAPGQMDSVAAAEGALSDALQSGDVTKYHQALDQYQSARAAVGLPTYTGQLLVSDLTVLAHQTGTVAGQLADQVAQNETDEQVANGDGSVSYAQAQGLGQMASLQTFHVPQVKLSLNSDSSDSKPDLSFPNLSLFDSPITFQD